MDEERVPEGAETPESAVDDDAIETAGSVASAGRRAINEDWAATIVGLVLLVLILAGVIPTGLVP